MINGSIPCQPSSAPITSRRGLAVLGAAVTGLVVLHPLLYAGMFAGDAEIHLAYAERAAQGRFFEFNPGEKSPGVTSPGYMLLVAVLFQLLPATWVPLAMKVLGYAAWYGLVALVFLLARRLIRDRSWVWTATAVAGLLPGSAYNAVIGMENGIFGFFVLAFFLLTQVWRRNYLPASGEAGRGALLGTILGLLCWLRPEGFVLAPLAAVYHAALRTRSGEGPAALLRPFLAVAIPAGVLGAAAIYFHLSQTGWLIPASGASRLLSSWRESVAIGPLQFSPKFTVRLLAYMPLTLAFLVGNFLILRRRVSEADFVTCIAYIGLFWLFFVLYSAVIGSSHLARYVIFLLPFLVLIAVWAAAWLWQEWARVVPVWLVERRSAVFGLALATLTVVFAVEAFQRTRLGAHDELAQAMDAPRIRSATSDALYRLLGQPPPPVQLLGQEVQVRYWLDERFVIRSTDGRTDPVLLDFYRGGNVDHAGYIRKRGIEFVLETPNYNRDPTAWGLDRLRGIPAGRTLEYDGLVFSRVLDGSRVAMPELTRQPIYRVQILR